MRLVANLRRDVTLADKAPVWMCRDGRLNLVPVWLMLIESLDMSLPLALMLFSI